MQHEVDQYEHRIKDISLAYQRNKERIKNLELILHQNRIEIPRETQDSSPSPLLRKRDVSPHEIYLRSNYTADENEEENLS